jgi:hypothetical protein
MLHHARTLVQQHHQAGLLQLPAFLVPAFFNSPSPPVAYSFSSVSHERQWSSSAREKEKTKATKQKETAAYTGPELWLGDDDTVFDRRRLPESWMAPARGPETRVLTRLAESIHSHHDQDPPPLSLYSKLPPSKIEHLPTVLCLLREVVLALERSPPSHKLRPLSDLLDAISEDVRHILASSKPMSTVDWQLAASELGCFKGDHGAVFLNNPIQLPSLLQTQTRISLVDAQLRHFVQWYAHPMRLLRGLFWRAKVLARNLPRLDDDCTLDMSDGITFSLAALVRLIIRRGKPGLALKVAHLFDLPPSNLIYSARLKAYLHLRFGRRAPAAVRDPDRDSKFTQQVVGLLSEMNAHGLPPDGVFLSTLIEGLGRLSDETGKPVEPFVGIVRHALATSFPVSSSDLRFIRESVEDTELARLEAVLEAMGLANLIQRDGPSEAKEDDEAPSSSVDNAEAVELEAGRLHRLVRRHLALEHPCRAREAYDQLIELYHRTRRTPTFGRAQTAVLNRLSSSFFRFSTYYIARLSGFEQEEERGAVGSQMDEALDLVQRTPPRIDRVNVLRQLLYRILGIEQGSMLPARPRGEEASWSRLERTLRLLVACRRDHIRSRATTNLKTTLHSRMRGYFRILRAPNVVTALVSATLFPPPRSPDDESSTASDRFTVLLPIWAELSVSLTEDKVVKFVTMATENRGWDGPAAVRRDLADLAEIIERFFAGRSRSRVPDSARGVTSVLEGTSSPVSEQEEVREEPLPKDGTPDEEIVEDAMHFLVDEGGGDQAGEDDDIDKGSQIPSWQSRYSSPQPPSPPTTMEAPLLSVARPWRPPESMVEANVKDGNPDEEVVEDAMQILVANAGRTL